MLLASAGSFPIAAQDLESALREQRFNRPSPRSQAVLGEQTRDRVVFVQQGDRCGHWWCLTRTVFRVAGLVSLKAIGQSFAEMRLSEVD